MTAFIICSRLKSSRLPSKPLLKYSGKTQIELLITQLLPTGYPIFVAVPESDVFSYSFLMDLFPGRVKLFSGYEDDPMARAYACAKANAVDRIIRVTHDKIFIDIDKLNPMIQSMDAGDHDYVYSSNFIPGTGFELMTIGAYESACQKFSRVEHVSYAMKSVSKNPLNFKFIQVRHNIRLLVDFIEDYRLMDAIFACIGHDIALKDVIKFLDKHSFLKHINKLPVVTVYTCAKNAAKWIREAMDSVAMQSNFGLCEYVLIDDYSDDRTILHMAKFCQANKNARFFRNEKNIGLASSSNHALKSARGKYIIRLDADDFFINKNVIESMIDEMESQSVDALYPNCYAGLSQRTVQKGNENYHVGGTLFRTSAMNHIKFTDNLMNYDSLDFFARARSSLKIGFYDKPTFCYRQHNESMSKNNLEERTKVRKFIREKYQV